MGTVGGVLTAALKWGDKQETGCNCRLILYGDISELYSSK